MVGLGILGMEDVDNGCVLIVNVFVVKGKLLCVDLEIKFGCVVKVENDVNCFVFFEVWDDELKEVVFVMGLILGTGFGGGLVYEGKVFLGCNYVVGEIGYMCLLIDVWFYFGEKVLLLGCGCGNKGCMDNYFFGCGFELLYEYYYGEKKKVIDIIIVQKEGEFKVVEYVECFMELLVICFVNIFIVNDLYVVVLGGGLLNYDLIYEEMLKCVFKYLFFVVKCLKIVKVKYGDFGGVCGVVFFNIK